jgi:hypothetical protein
MINKCLKKRLQKDRPSTTITRRIPTDVVESLKAVAPMRGFTAYQTLLKSYISEGLRRDEAQPNRLAPAHPIHNFESSFDCRLSPDVILHQSLSLSRTTGVARKGRSWLPGRAVRSAAVDPNGPV